MARPRRNRSRAGRGATSGQHGGKRGTQPDRELVPREPRWIDPGLTWFALWCRANQDRKAAAALEGAGLAAYRPLEARKVGVRGKVRVVEKSPVGRYLFAGLEPNRHFQAVRRALAPLDHGPVSLTLETRDGACTVSVRGFRATPLADLIRTDDGPLVIPAKLLQRFEDAIAAQGKPRTSPFRVGQLVKVMGGPMAGFSARLEEISDKRIKGLVDMFGRLVTVELGLEQLEQEAA